MKRVLEWFQQCGQKPFRYQRQAWRAYLAKESGLIHAPTGFGKTLAAWLGPVAEWLHEHPQYEPVTIDGEPDQTLDKSHKKIKRNQAEPLRAIWITPLRALANDTVQSLATPVRDLGLPWTIELRTGDISSSLRSRQRKRLPTALVITPESLSLLLSYPDAAELFSSLRSVIVDEWHELLGTKRGVQTELALARLRRWRPELSVWGLSATIGNLNEAAQVLMGQCEQPTRVIAGPRQKRIELHTLLPDDITRFPWSGRLGKPLVDQVVTAIKNARSTLLFTNTRSQAELWHQELLNARPDWLTQLALHHGSLDRELRQKVEQLLDSGQLRCVVCTSSMDLGVDFAPVDQVVQLGSPKGIARLMQRAGRSGHQPGATSRVLCVPTHSFELVEFAAARVGISERSVETKSPLTKPLDVLIQHLVTIAAGGGFESDALYHEVRQTWAYRDLSPEEWEWVLSFVAIGGTALHAYPNFNRLREQNGRYTVRSKEIERMHRMNIGTITSDSALRVKLQHGGMLGSIEESFIAKLRPGDKFIFAGRLLELKRVRDMTAQVSIAKQKRGVVPRWNGGRFPLSTHLAQTVRRMVSRAADGDFKTREMRSVKPMLTLQAQWSHLPAMDELLIERTPTREGEHWFLFPFEGRLVHEGVASLLAYRLSQREPNTIKLAANDYGIELLATTPQALDVDSWHRLLHMDNLVEDLLACVNMTQMARRQFRDIARVAGLVMNSHPGQQKLTRHLQASSELFFDVFEQYDPDNLLLKQSQREVLEQQLELNRLRAALQRIRDCKLVLIDTPQLSPLAFPLWSERLRTQYVSSEKWSARVSRMAKQLEDVAQRNEKVSYRGRRRQAMAASKCKSA